MTSDSKTPYSKMPQKLFKWLWREIVLPLSVALVFILFLIQAFQIPSSSMENTLLKGDFLLGLKFLYGSEVPYLDQQVPGFTDPEVGEVIIFRYPGEPEYPDYNPERYSHIANLLFAGNYYWDKTPAPGEASLIEYFQGPKDYIKRLVAESGQTVELRDKKLYVDGKESPIAGQGKWTDANSNYPVRDQLSKITLPKPGQNFLLDTLSLVELHKIRALILQENPDDRVEVELNLFVDSIKYNNYIFPNFLIPGNMPNVAPYMQFGKGGRVETLNGPALKAEVPFAQFAHYARTGFIASNEKSPSFAANSFIGQRPLIPKSSFKRIVTFDYYNWPHFLLLEQNVSRQNTQRAQTLATDSTSIPQPKLRLQAHVLFNGKRIDRYTIKDKVYFMVGDNRDNSLDSRFWGFLSRKNIKAKAFITYFSVDWEGMQLTNPFTWLKLPFLIRWNRIGRLIHDV